MNQRGFTLIEIIIVMVVLGIIAGITLQVLFSGVEAYVVSRERKVLYDQVRLALERMVREIRDADQVVTPTPGTTASSIRFTKVHSSPMDAVTDITFQLNGTNLERVRTGLSTEVLAGNVTSFQVSHSGKRLVMVTTDGGTNDGGGHWDATKRSIFEGFGYTVTAIDDQAPLATFQAAAAANDVMFISESVLSTYVGTKARDLDIGIVNEEQALLDEMEFTVGSSTGFNSGTQISLVDNSHYITSLFATGSMSVFTANDAVWYTAAPLAAGAQLLANEPGSGSPGMLAFETGATLDGGFIAQNRRVSVHFMHESVPGLWTANMQTLLKRSLDWAAGRLGGETIALEITASSSLGGTVTMRSQVYTRNIY